MRRSLYKQSLGVVLIFVFSLSLTASLGMAIDTPTAASTEAAQGTLQTSQALPVDYAYVEGSPNVQMDIMATGTGPADFTLMNYRGIGTPVSRDTGEHYPLQVGTLTNTFTGDTMPESNGRWVQVQNNTVDQFGNYTIGLSTNILGTLSVGSTQDFTCNRESLILRLNIENQGIYRLWYDDGAITPSNIASPTNNYVDFTTGDLPETPAGEVIRSYVIFVAEETGLYQFSFATTEKYISLELTYYEGSGLSFGSMIKFQDPDYSMSTADLLDSDSGPILNAYSFSVTAGTMIRYNFNLIWGNPSVFLYLPTPDGYGQMSLVTTGVDSAIVPGYSGTAYLTVIHDEYFTWTGTTDSEQIVKNPLYYKMIFNTDTPSAVPLDATTELTVSYEQAFNMYYVDVPAESYILFNYTAVQNSPVISTDGDDIFAYIKDGYVNGVNVAYTSNSKGYFYWMQTGRYYFAVGHPLNIVENVYLNVSFTTLDIGSTSLQAVAASSTLNGSIYTGANSSTIEFGPTVGENIPVFMKYVVPAQTISHSLVVDIRNDDNPEVFDQQSPFARILLYEDGATTYTDITNSTGAVEMFSSSSAQGDYIMFGLDHRFTEIPIDLNITATSGTFTWRYASGASTWTNIGTSYFTDGTNNGSRALEKDGSLIIDPSGWNWNAYARNGSTLFWIGLLCNTAPTTIPTLVAPKAMQTTIYRVLQLTYTVKLGTLSPYDDSTPSWFLSSSPSTLTISPSNLGANISINPTQFFPKTTEAVFLFGFTLSELNTLSPTTYKGYNASINLRIMGAEYNSRRLVKEYNANNSVTDIMDAETFNAFSGFDDSSNVNGSLVDYIVYHVTGYQAHDWLQFNTKAYQSATSTNTIWFYNPSLTWFSTSAPTGSSFSFSGTANSSTEFGALATDFYVVLPVVENAATENVTVELWIGGYSAKIISANIAPGEQPKEIDWLLIGLIAGGAAVAAGVVGFILYKKKHIV